MQIGNASALALQVEIDILTGETQVNSFDLVYVSWTEVEAALSAYPSVIHKR